MMRFYEILCYFLICEQHICTWLEAGGLAANTGAWQLNKGDQRLQQFLGPHIYTLTPANISTIFYDTIRY